MLVKIIKAGKVAERGIIIHSLVKGEEKEVSDIFGARLIELGHVVIKGKKEDVNKELEALKKEATELNINFHPNIGMEKLKIKIKEGEEGEEGEAKEKALPKLENKAITNLNNKNKE